MKCSKVRTRYHVKLSLFTVLILFFFSPFSNMLSLLPLLQHWNIETWSLSPQQKYKFWSCLVVYWTTPTLTRLSTRFSLMLLLTKFVGNMAGYLHLLVRRKYSLFPLCVLLPAPWLFSKEKATKQGEKGQGSQKGWGSCYGCCCQQVGWKEAVISSSKTFFFIYIYTFWCIFLQNKNHFHRLRPPIVLGTSHVFSSKCNAMWWSSSFMMITLIVVEVRYTIVMRTSL